MENTRERLRAATQNMRSSWPSMAGQLVAVREAADLTLRQFGALMMLDGGETVPLDRMVGTLGREVRDALAHLADRKLVEQRPEGYQLTPAGEALLQKTVDMRIALMDDIASRLQPADRDEILRAWDVLGRVLNRTPAPA